MSEFIEHINGYDIKRATNGDYIVYNTRGGYKHHGHFKKLSTCKVIIQLMTKHIVPDSDYLVEAARRMTIDEEYLKRLEDRQNKSKKPRYYNSNKGVRK